MKKTLAIVIVLVPALFVIMGSNSTNDLGSVRDRLIKWRTGVWLSAGGTYTIWTPKHYFVLSMSGDSASPNLYYGCSQVSYHEKGITRHQVQRFRRFPGGDPTMFSENTLTGDDTEAPYAPDTTLFNPDHCVIKDGVIYDAVVEATDTYILLISCNGDREKIFSDGRSVYMPAGGGEAYSYRVERL
jgi:hypothetical protein